MFDIKFEELNKLSKACFENSAKKGFWNSQRDWPESLVLIHSEVSEALEDIRENKLRLTYAQSGKPEGLPSELADIVIRVFDVCGKHNIDLAEAVEKKMEYNSYRPFMHNKNF